MTTNPHIVARSAEPQMNKTPLDIYTVNIKSPRQGGPLIVDVFCATNVSSGLIVETVPFQSPTVDWPSSPEELASFSFRCQSMTLKAVSPRNTISISTTLGVETRKSNEKQSEASIQVFSTDSCANENIAIVSNPVAVSSLEYTDFSFQVEVFNNQNTPLICRVSLPDHLLSRRIYTGRSLHKWALMLIIFVVPWVAALKRPHFGKVFGRKYSERLNSCESSETKFDENGASASTPAFISGLKFQRALSTLNKSSRVALRIAKIKSKGMKRTVIETTKESERKELLALCLTDFTMTLGCETLRSVHPMLTPQNSESLRYAVQSILSNVTTTSVVAPSEHRHISMPSFSVVARFVIRNAIMPAVAHRIVIESVDFIEKGVSGEVHDLVAQFQSLLHI